MRFRSSIGNIAGSKNAVSNKHREQILTKSIYARIVTGFSNK